MTWSENYNKLTKIQYDKISFMNYYQFINLYYISNLKYKVTLFDSPATDDLKLTQLTASLPDLFESSLAPSQLPQERFLTI